MYCFGSIMADATGSIRKYGENIITLNQLIRFSSSDSGNLLDLKTDLDYQTVLVYIEDWPLK